MAAEVAVAADVAVVSALGRTPAEAGHRLEDGDDKQEGSVKKNLFARHSTTNGFSIRSPLRKVLWDRHYFGCETVMSYSS